jgi:uncharacterized protein
MLGQSCTAQAAQHLDNYVSRLPRCGYVDARGTVMSARERDARGRPLNARPRDGLGRPMPRGSSGVPRVPDDLILPPADSLAEAQRLLDDGLPFHAHEVLEGTWKAAPEHERDLWQGLAQLAVGFTHRLRGNDAGASALFRRARDRIAGYASDPPHDIDVPGLVAWADTQLQELARKNDAAGTPAPPRLMRLTSS